jgi:hypothetical protein
MPLLFENLKDKQVFIARKTQTAGTDKFLATTVTSAFMHIQPISDRDASLYEGITGKSYVLFCDGTVDVQEGDKLRNGTDYYKVVANGVSRRTFGSFDYLRIVVEKIN